MDGGGWAAVCQMMISVMGQRQKTDLNHLLLEHLTSNTMASGGVMERGTLLTTIDLCMFLRLPSTSSHELGVWTIPPHGQTPAMASIRISYKEETFSSAM